jgi:segregation and condensation protein A
MTTSFAQSAIAVLIDLAQRGEIDPWDVQVIEVFDRFLSELALTDPRDLSRSGQAFLYASMLVLLKSDSLTAVEPSDAEPLEDLAMGEDLLTNPTGLPARLEQYLHRRAVAPPPQRRRVTLNELISQLELMAATVEGKLNTPNRTRTVQPRQSRAQAARTIAHLAHQENLSEVASELEQFLTHHWPQLSQSQDWLDLPHLLEFKNDRVGVFWALLFLCAQSKVELSQSEFYQDLKLRPLIMEAL